MARVKRGVVAHAKHKKVLEQAKGFYGRRKNTIRTAKAAVDKAGQYAYRDRRVRKREYLHPAIQRDRGGRVPPHGHGGAQVSRHRRRHGRDEARRHGDRGGPPRFERPGAREFPRARRCDEQHAEHVWHGLALRERMRGRKAAEAVRGQHERPVLAPEQVTQGL